MKKTPLYIASALLSVLLLSGYANAKTAEQTATNVVSAASSEAKGVAAAPKAGRPDMPKLSEAGQKILRESMEKTREEHKASFEAIEAKHKELQDIMKASTFDKSAYLAKEAEIQALHQKMMTSRSESLAAALEQMTPADRAAFSQGGPRPHMMGKGMGKGMGDPENCPMMGKSGTAPASKAEPKTTE